MLRALVFVLVAVALSAGCAAAPAPTAAPAADDAGYASMMIPHHEQALELSALVAGRTTDPTVTDLAFRIDREQVEEVGQLQGFLNLRGAPAPAPMGAMAGMADAATLDRLRASSGPAFDRLWLQTMVAHHEGALTMSRQYLAGPPGALSEFARTVLRGQQLEIDRMRAALGPV
ncbi:hypothetical protein GCM10023201_05840 [Actinomycetospora corticicola]|uniref:Uncharacterized protein (DUF305 family) n=1 Tax=Actinomycetospora corticicola TaxID=663602 RepID=A0A7Y9DSL2_9PSEU|nr:uncharacterized protein (DUF305 family) [Actinomycetospora corticicola]